MKLRQFQHLLAKNKIDLAFFSHDDPAVYYFIGSEFTGGYLLITPHQAILFLSPLDHKPKKQGVIVRNLAPGWSAKYANSTFQSIGINKANLTVELLDRIKKIFPRAKVKDISSSLEQLRLKKTKTELVLMVKACALTSAAFQALLKELPQKKLKTEQDVALFLEAFIRQRRGTIAFPTIVAVGKNSAIPHHLTSTTRLRCGFLQLDFGARINGYCADMSRVLFLGKPTTEEKRLYHLLADAQQAALDTVKSGISLKELDHIARMKLGKYASYFNHALGHGIGIEVHEQPAFFDPHAVVMKDVPFTIEPGIYLPGKFGIRIEDTLVWNGKKREILTKAPKNFITIPFSRA